MTIHLKGVGWTDFDNIYVATYDNAYMGYACGFNSQGDVVINFTAAGAPGMHLIDFYPGIYQGPEKEQHCIGCLNSPTPTITPATRYRRCALPST